ncbi:MAG: DUF2103 domain-containing protein [Candidatus Pacebacteria bacterium]|nr:DUF2103 domain-containing protein [Candidatus Paceibacterota bacterium]
MNRAKRSKEHTTLTETAKEIVRVIERIPGVKRIAPGVIDARRSGKRHVTANYTTAGMELLISGQGVQKVAIHTDKDPKAIFGALKTHKKLKNFAFHEREKKPGI